MKRYKAHIAKPTPEAKQFVKDYLQSLTAEQRIAVREMIQDSVERCPQLGEVVMFIDPALAGNTPKHLLQLCDVIQFGRGFVYDDGEKAVSITLDNYKDVDYREWLTESPYEEINI